MKGHTVTHFMTDDQKLIVQSVREFCTSPTTKAMVAEEVASGKFPRRSWKAAGEQGYLGAFVPEEYGGEGYDLTTFFLIVEELMRNGYPIMAPLGGHYLSTMAILKWGSEEIKQHYLPGICNGDTLLCGAITDPAGLANFPEWNFKQEQVDGGWKISCNKVLVTNPMNCDVAVIFGPPAKGHHLPDQVYIVEKGTPGFEVGTQEKKLLDGFSDWGGLNLTDVFVPEDHHLTNDNVNWLGTSFLLLAMQAMVTGENAFNIAMNYATTRTRYGKPLVALQTVSHTIADMAIRNEASRDMVYTGTRLWDEGREDESYRVCLMAKAFVTAEAGKSLHDAAVMHGGAGYARDTGIGNMWINSLCLEIAEMPPAIHKDWLMETYGVHPGWKEDQD
jgi:alkylation response protein AidB-like acyl-CoA dehydrogenase